MTPEQRAEVIAYWRRALEAQQEMQVLLERQFFRAAVSRAYYAAYYATSALLLARGQDYSRHSAIIAAVHRDLVKTGQMSVATARWLNNLFALRTRGDYDVVEPVSEIEAAEALTQARAYVLALGELLRQSGITIDG